MGYSLFPIKDMPRLHLEFSLGFHFNKIPINYMITIMHIFLNQRNMKYIMASHASMQPYMLLVQFI